MQEELAVTRALGAPASLGRTLRVLGTLELETASTAWREAVDVLDSRRPGSTRQGPEPRIGSALGARGSRPRRATPARSARARRRLRRRRPGRPVRSELHAAGFRPRRDALSGVDSLTPSGAARRGTSRSPGAANREIAQELYVTPKTVEVHLSNAYRKLGIRSRRELSGALAPA